MITGTRLLWLAATAGHAFAASYIGCYNTAGSLTTGDTWDWQSDGHCTDICKGKSAPLFALTGGSTCLCGSSLPSTGLVDKSMCSTNCTGWPTVKCGGTGFFSFFNTGIQAAIPPASDDTSSSSTTSTTPTGTSATASVVTRIQPDRTIIVTQSASADSGSTDTSSSSKPNIGAIAGGVAGGVIILLGLAGAVFFFTRRSRRAHRDGHQRHSSAALVGGAYRTSPPPMSQRGSPETRYDAEAMANRRLSDGSIADNEDFSRRILKVTNPDDRL